MILRGEEELRWSKGRKEPDKTWRVQAKAKVKEKRMRKVFEVLASIHGQGEEEAFQLGGALLAEPWVRL